MAGGIIGGAAAAGGGGIELSVYEHPQGGAGLHVLQLGATTA